MNQKTVRRLAALTIALVGLVSGCNMDTSTEPIPLVDHLSFSYSGAVSGAFDATGNPQAAVDDVIPRADYAGALAYDASTSVPLAGTFSASAARQRRSIPHRVDRHQSSPSRMGNSISRSMPRSSCRTAVCSLAASHSPGS